jgi:hypothetical protein
MDMSDNIVMFPGFSPKRGRASPGSSKPQEEASNWRSREHIQEDIELHIAARVAYGKAVAWEAAAESENLPPAQIEEARQRTAKAFEEMRYRGRNLLICMPTERRALVDLLLYLEKNFTCCHKRFLTARWRSICSGPCAFLSADMRNMDKDGDCRAPTIEVRTPEPSASQAAR